MFRYTKVKLDQDRVRFKHTPSSKNSPDNFEPVSLPPSLPPPTPTILQGCHEKPWKWDCCADQQASERLGINKNIMKNLRVVCRSSLKVVKFNAARLFLK